MRYLDYICAWMILLVAVSFTLFTEISHPPGAVLDVPFLWTLVAMLNFLRLRNDYPSLKGLKITCIGANLIALTLETVRLKLFGSVILKSWGPFALIVTLAVLGETIFSFVQMKESH
jgi:hypothetical protein